MDNLQYAQILPELPVTEVDLYENIEIPLLYQYPEIVRCQANLLNKQGTIVLSVDIHRYDFDLLGDYAPCCIVDSSKIVSGEDIGIYSPNICRTYELLVKLH